MKLVGVVRWITVDRGGHRIAGVQPLYEILKPKWRKVDAAEEYPTQGQVFWWDASDVAEGSLVQFRAERNSPGQKDEYIVVDPHPAMEIIDLRAAGDATAARRALLEGVHRPSSSTGKFHIWCDQNILVGPVRLAMTPAGTLTFDSSNHRDKIAVFPAGSPEKVFDGHHERLLRVEDTPATGYVDWGDDTAIVKRALRIAVDLSRKNGRDIGLTSRQIEEAAGAIVVQGLDGKLDRYRLERALSLCQDAEYLAHHAQTIAQLLQEHPSVSAALEALRAQVRRDVEFNARAELASILESEREAIRQLQAEHERVSSSLLEEKAALKRANDEVAHIETAVGEKVRAAIERPAELLAQASVLRPLLAQHSSGASPPSEPRISAASVSEPQANGAPAIAWSRSDMRISERIALQRALKAAAQAAGVSPTAMTQLHAAVIAQLVPVGMGSAALSGFAAYARVACGDRISMLSIAPNYLVPDDLRGSRWNGGFEAHATGLAAASAATRKLDARSLLLLEGANRAPLESLLLPLLQVRDATQHLPTSAVAAELSPTRSLVIAGTFVAGATTVPVTPQLWSHAVAVDMQPGPLVPAAVKPTELTEDLFQPGPIPRETIDALINAWPGCAEVQISLERFGAALAAHYSDKPRVRSALLEGIVLPFLVSIMAEDEEEEALTALAEGDDQILASARRLRKRLR